MKDIILGYEYYLGDGDSSSFQSVEDAKPYGADFTIKKLECIGHIQKRVGGRLRKLRAEWRGEELSDGKKISGAGRLTESVFNKLQNYFGIAIRQNTDSAYSMKKCALASLFHNTAFDDNKPHGLCPIGENSWCKWQREVAVSGKSGFKPKLSLPNVIFDFVFPIYQDLSKDKLLEKCLHGKTQNANEALPKNVLIFGVF